jgi:hypothetical protein
MTSQELFTEMKQLWDAVELNHDQFVNKGNKSAATRARTAAGELKKLVTEYRKQSVSESKKA